MRMFKHWSIILSMGETINFSIVKSNLSATSAITTPDITHQKRTWKIQSSVTVLARPTKSVCVEMLSAPGMFP